MTIVIMEIQHCPAFALLSSYKNISHAVNNIKKNRSPYKVSGIFVRFLTKFKVLEIFE